MWPLTWAPRAGAAEHGTACRIAPLCFVLILLFAEGLALQAPPAATTPPPPERKLRLNFTQTANITVARQVAANLTVPPDFCASVFYDAESIPNARNIALSQANSLIYISTRYNDKVFALQDADRDGKAEGPLMTVLTDLATPNGIAWHLGDLYVAQIDALYKIVNVDEKILNGTFNQERDLQLISSGLPSNTTHGWRHIAFGPDGMLYIPIGAPCNVCFLTEVAPGLTYGAIWRMNADGTGAEQYASGVRDPQGLDWHPDTGEMYFSDNGRDLMGDDTPDDELNYAPTSGMDFGFPYCHTQGLGNPYMRNVGGGTPVFDPDANPNRTVNCSVTAAQAMGPHVAALGMTFYTGTAFPAEYNRTIFVALHGSWNRAVKIGYSVVQVRVSPNGTALQHLPFVDGWGAGCNTSELLCGRPVDVAQYYDGSLLITDDSLGTVYRIAYGSQCGVSDLPASTSSSPPPPASSGGSLVGFGSGCARPLSLALALLVHLLAFR